MLQAISTNLLKHLQLNPVNLSLGRTQYLPSSITFIKAINSLGFKAIVTLQSLYEKETFKAPFLFILKKKLLSITAGALQNRVSEVVAMFRQADVILSCSLTRSIALEPRKEQVTRVLSGETKLSSHFSNFLRDMAPPRALPRNTPDRNYLCLPFPFS